MKKIVLFIILYFFTFLNVNADCGTSDIAALKQLASNVNFNYMYRNTDSDIIFDIYVSNINEELYLQDDLTEKKYVVADTKDGILILQNFQAGKQYSFTIRSYNDDCFNTKLLIKKITLPMYNVYYNDPACVGKEEFNLCKRWTTNLLNYDDFLKQVTNYKKNDDNITIDSIEEKNSFDFIEILSILYFQYYWIILPIIIIVLITLIVFLKKKDDLFK